MPGVKPGELGGYVESENNLSHEGWCWVYPDSTLSGSSQISGDLKVKNSILEDAIITGNGTIQNSVIKDSILRSYSICVGNDDATEGEYTTQILYSSIKGYKIKLSGHFNELIIEGVSREVNLSGRVN